MAEALPAITGPQLIRLLRRDGWAEVGRVTHGVSLHKTDPDGRTRVTVIPTKRRSLPTGTLAAILGPKQTCIGRNGLRELIDRHGLR